MDAGDYHLQASNTVVKGVGGTIQCPSYNGWTLIGIYFIFCSILLLFKSNVIPGDNITITGFTMSGCDIAFDSYGFGLAISNMTFASVNIGVFYNSHNGKLTVTGIFLKIVTSTATFIGR